MPITVEEAMVFAGTKLIQLGMELRYTSTHGTKYYGFPNNPWLIRVADHHSNRIKSSGNVLAQLNFSPTAQHPDTNDNKMTARIAETIGRFMLKIIDKDPNFKPSTVLDNLDRLDRSQYSSKIK